MRRLKDDNGTHETLNRSSRAKGHKILSIFKTLKLKSETIEARRAENTVFHFKNFFCDDHGHKSKMKKTPSIAIDTDVLSEMDVSAF